MQKKNIGMIAPFTSYSGYGQYGRAIAKMLIQQYKNNEDISIFLFDFNSNVIAEQQIFSLQKSFYSQIVSYIQPNEKIQQQFFDIFMTVSVPMSFVQKGLINIGITALSEVDKLHPNLITHCNRMDEVIVMSQFNINSLKQSIYQTREGQQINLSVPVCKLNHPLKFVDNKQKSDISQFIDSIPQQFLFLTIGEWLPGSIGNDRKDIGALISTFIRAFPNNKDVGLLLKCDQGRSSMLSQYSIKQRMLEISRGLGINMQINNVYFITGNLSQSQISQIYLHNKIKSYISFTHGQSYGIPIMQFSGITGKPMVIPYHSGLEQYILPQYNDILISKMAQVSPELFQTFYRDFLIPQSRWNIVQYQYALFKMTQFIKEYKSKLQKSKQQQKHIRDNFSYEKIGTQLSNILNKYLIQE